MANSLLAHLYSRIKGSQEDVATLSLQYLLSQSAELNRAYTSLLSTAIGRELDTKLEYICQATGEGKERPDLAAVDENGHEVLLCEMKFYAGLTDNQPSAYLERLKKENGQGLVFVCPKARQTSLWAKLRDLCAGQSIVSVNERCIQVNTVNMAIVTWTEVIEQLRWAATASAVEYLADIQQLDGYCAQMDSDAFIPFSAEEMTAETAKRIGRYYDIVDEVISLLRADSSVKTSLKGLKATAYRTGYMRSIYVDEFALSINYDIGLWESNSSVETPFWVAFRDEKWEQGHVIQAGLKKIPSHKKDDLLWKKTWLALEPLCNATFDEVCVDLKRQILNYVELFRLCR